MWWEVVRKPGGGPGGSDPYWTVERRPGTLLLPRPVDDHGTVVGFAEKEEGRALLCARWLNRQLDLRDDAVLAERVLPLFERRHPEDGRPRAALEAVKALLTARKTE